MTAILGCPQGSNSGWWVLLYNHNANKYWYVLSDDKFIDYYKLTGKWSFQPLIAILLIWPLGVILGFIPKLIVDILIKYNDYTGVCVAFAFLFGAALSVSYWVFGYKSVKNKREKIANMIRAHLDSLVDEIIK